MNETYLYPYSVQEAKKRNQLPMWRESFHANVACRNAIEETIRQNFDGMHLKKDFLEPVLAEYGYKRTEWVLATTLQELSWDGRFSRTNKQWAARRYIPQDERHNAEITVRSHPAISSAASSARTVPASIAMLTALPMVQSGSIRMQKLFTTILPAIPIPRTARPSLRI